MQGKGCGIICEYNPFHKGHKYQLDMAKESFPFTVCVMSGDFVQRGEASFQKKEVRARNAVMNGADIVLELPFPYSSFGAEGFARKGVEILDGSGLCSHIMFGSECGDVNILKDIAKVLVREGFYGEVIKLQKQEKNLSFARARSLYIEKEMGQAYARILDNPNDILGVEYIKAIIKLESKLCPVAIKRSTPRGGFDEAFASSSYIRQNLFDSEKGGFAKSKLPENYDFSGIFKNKDELLKLMHVSLMMKTPKELESILEVPSGYGYLITDCARKSESFEEMCLLLSGKTMTESKIKRMLLFAFFGISKEVYGENAEYTQVLALSDKGGEMLKKYRDEAKIIVACRIKDIKCNETAYEQYSRSRLAWEVLSKCAPTE